MTTNDAQPSTALWEAIRSLDALDLLHSIDTTDARETYRVLQCLNACTYTLRGLVFRLAHRCDQLVTNPDELPDDGDDDPAALVHSVATVLLMAERSLDAVQESLHAARDDMADLFPGSTP